MVTPIKEGCLLKFDANPEYHIRHSKYLKELWHLHPPMCTHWWSLSTRMYTLGKSSSSQDIIRIEDEDINSKLWMNRPRLNEDINLWSLFMKIY